MFKSIVEDVKREFSYGNMITQIIIVNAVIFGVINLVRLFFVLTAGFEDSGSFDTFMKYLSLSSDLVFDFTHPWVFISHMFTHKGFWHFLFNMLFLFWFGRIVGDFIGNKKILPLYLLSGFFGALIFLITAPLVYPGTITAIGASAAVMGIVVASGTLAPDYIMRLLFIGDVKLKYIVFVLVFLDIISIGNLVNTGGHFAHLGGAAFGWIFITMLRQGTDLSIPVNKMLDGLVTFVSGSGQPQTKKKKKSTPIFVRHKSQSRAASRSESSPKSGPSKDLNFQDKLDGILDKIKASGYESLTAEEKEFLFQASKK